MDFNNVVLPVHVLNGLRDDIELELLGFLWWIDHVSNVEISVSVHLEESVSWKLRDHDEWSVDIETEFFVHSLGWDLWCFININDLPSLVETIMLRPGDDILPFKILSLIDIKSFAEVVDNMFTLVFEQLPPLLGGNSDLNVFFNSKGFHVENVSWVLSRVDTLVLVVKVPNLGGSTIWYLYDNIGTNSVKVSSGWHG